MTYNPNLDRTDWRARDDRALIEAARESGHELAIALGERLDAFVGMDDALADAQAECIELQGRCDALRRELDELHDALAADAEEPRA
jgi:hypothetical protein